MNYNQLGKTGLMVSSIGLGGCSIGNHYGAIEYAEGYRTVMKAIDVGINFFDTSPYYGDGLSEERLEMKTRSQTYLTVYLVFKFLDLSKKG